MAISFFKKSFSAYYGYENKVTNPDTVEEEDEESENEHSDQSDEAKTSKSEGRVQRLAKSKSAYEIVNLAKKNLVDKLSTNVTKLATYDHHSLLKSIQKEGDDSTDEDDEFLDSYDQTEEESSFTLYEQEKGLPNQPFSLVIPKALPIDLKQQILQQQIIDSSSLEDEDEEDEEEAKSSDEDRQIDFDKYDEYGFLKTTKKSKRISENLMRIDSEEDQQRAGKEEEDEPSGNQEKAGEKNDEKQFEKLRNKWLTYLELTYSQVDEPAVKWYQSIEPKIKHTPKLDSLIECSPIPYFLRSQLWPRFSNACLMKEKCEFSYSVLCKNSNHIKTCNDKHSLRILPNNVCFQDPLSKVNQSLRRILRVIKWIERDGVDPILNNSEALNLPLVAAYLLLIFNEEDVFWLLLSISNEWKSVFTNKTGLFAKPNNNDLIKSLIKKHAAELEEKLDQEEIDLNVLINNWFTGLFADVINDTHILLHLWDLYFYHGFIVMFQLTFGLLLYRKEELIKCNNSVDLINSVSGLPDALTASDTLLQIWKLGREHVKNLDQEFYGIQNPNGLQGDLLRIGVPAVQLFNENTSGIRLLPSSSSLSRISDLNNELKYKNVRQSAILMELHESILAIAQHFQSNDSDFKCNLTIDYDPKEVNKYKAHKSGLNRAKPDKKKEKCKRARALIDFKRIDDDELGFRKNDIIKILEDRDEHCWAGELNDQQGLFPSKLVEIINESYGNYNEFGDDSVHPFISDLVRGRLCAVIKCILNNGLRKGYFYTVHPFMVIEALAKNYMKSQQNNICSKVVLTKTFKLDDFENNMNVKELFYKSILVINESHANEPMDVKLRSLICVALNHKLLDSWFTIYCLEDKSLIQKYYHSWAYVSTPVWQMIKMELALLKQFSFNLNPNAELLQEIQNTSSVSKAVVRDLLVKHHLFSWDI